MTSARAAELGRRLGRHEGAGAQAYGRAVCAEIRRAVGYDFSCFATGDPATGMVTGTVKDPDVDARDAELAHYEYAVDDLNQFADLARRPVPVGLLRADTAGAPGRSRRYAEFLEPGFGFGHELRVAFRADGLVWGAISLYRDAGPRGFTAADARLLGEVSATVARGIRRSLIAGAVGTGSGGAGPVVLVLGEDGILQTTPAADRLLRDSGGVPMALLAVASAARAVAAGRADVVPRARMRTPTGGWATAHAVCVPGRSGAGPEVVLTVEDARPPEIVPLVVAALGLTRREQDVVGLVLQGAGTAAVAAQLHLSPYTVQDHLRSVFAKAGVSSSRELTAKIFFEHVAPRIGSPLGADGGFAP